MTEKSNMADDAKRGHEAIYDPTANSEDWSFTDLDGNTVEEKQAETNELYPSIFVSAGNKTLEIYHEKFGTLWACRFKEGGELPRSLKGKFTSPEDAKLAADLYVAQLDTE